MKETTKILIILIIITLILIIGYYGLQLGEVVIRNN